MNVVSSAGKTSCPVPKVFPTRAKEFETGFRQDWTLLRTSSSSMFAAIRKLPTRRAFWAGFIPVSTGAMGTAVVPGVWAWIDAGIARAASTTTTFRIPA
jgi:hypothetical protein